MIKTTTKSSIRLNPRSSITPQPFLEAIFGRNSLLETMLQFSAFTFHSLKAIDRAGVGKSGSPHAKGGARRLRPSHVSPLSVRLNQQVSADCGLPTSLSNVAVPHASPANRESTTVMQ